MKIFYQDSFKKSYKKRYKNNKKLVAIIRKRIALFIENPTNAQLRLHELKGSRKGYYSFSITGDIRVIYFIYQHRVYFIDIGTHNQIY